MNEVSDKAVRRAEEHGGQQYQVFAEGRLVNSSKPLDDPVTKNKLQLFRQPPARDKIKSNL